MRAPACPWIVMRGEELRCERCGATHRPGLPAPIKTFVRELRAFIEVHKRCGEGKAI